MKFKSVLALGWRRFLNKTLFFEQVDCVRRSTPEQNFRTYDRCTEGEARLRAETALRRAKVEPERIELSSREDKPVPSTCLVVFEFSGTARQTTA